MMDDERGMPLTLAHTAAALPLHAVARRRGLAVPLSALVIGSMTPDFEYLARLRPQGTIGHSAIGLVVFCLPVGLGAWLVFRSLVAPALVRLLPSGLAAAPPIGSPARGASRMLLAAAGILLGATSHIIWDSFTHGGGWVVARVAWLRAPAAATLVPGLRWYTVLQHASTVVGLAVISIALTRWIRRQPHDARRFGDGEAWRFVGVAAAVLAVTTVGAVLNASRAMAGTASALGLAAVGGMSALAIAMLVYGLIAAAREGQRRVG